MVCGSEEDILATLLLFPSLRYHIYKVLDFAVTFSTEAHGRKTAHCPVCSYISPDKETKQEVATEENLTTFKVSTKTKTLLWLPKWLDVIVLVRNCDVCGFGFTFSDPT